MIQIFIDTSVLFAACTSKIGAAAGILRLCKKGQVQGNISEYVINEARRNISSLNDQDPKHRLNKYLQQFHLIKVETPSTTEIEYYEEIINRKDAPILAAAIKCQAAYLITFNTKDFMQPKVEKLVKPLKVTTPRDFIFLSRKQYDQSSNF